MTRAFKIALSIVFAVPCFGAVIDSPDLNETNVAALIASGSVSNGDTVLLPPGTATWTASLPITKAITLSGSGVGVTILRDGIVSRAGLIGYIGTTPGLIFRITQITFKFAPGVDGLGTVGVIQASGQGNGVIVDHNSFDRLRGVNVKTTEGVTGDIYANDFGQWTSSVCVNVYHNIWQGIGQYGDFSWFQPLGFGSTNALYIEGNTFNHLGTTPNIAITDFQSGSRVVFRYNTITNGVIHNHGTETDGRLRSALRAEIYGNTQMSTTNVLNTQAIFSRGGTGLVFSNTITGYDSLFGGVCFMSRGQFWYGDGTNSPGATGINGWHSNYTGGPFFAGTAAGSDSASTNGYRSIQISGSPSWTANQWAGYTIMNMTVTNFNGISGAHPFGEIIANNSDTVFYACDIRGSFTNAGFSVGQTVDFWHVNAAFDQVGSSGGTLISGDTPAFVNYDQVASPVYLWANTLNGAALFDNFNYSVIVPGRNWTNIALSGYSPVVYPLPLVSGLPPPPPPASTNTPVVITGNVKLKGGINIHTAQ